jgi:hypothetical protein
MDKMLVTGIGESHIAARNLVPVRFTDEETPMRE